MQIRRSCKEPNGGRFFKLEKKNSLKEKVLLYSKSYLKIQMW